MGLIKEAIDVWDVVNSHLFSAFSYACCSGEAKEALEEKGRYIHLL